MFLLNSMALSSIQVSNISIVCFFLSHGTNIPHFTEIFVYMYQHFVSSYLREWMSYSLLKHLPIVEISCLFLACLGTSTNSVSMNNYVESFCVCACVDIKSHFWAKCTEVQLLCYLVSWSLFCHFKTSKYFVVSGQYYISDNI